MNMTFSFIISTYNRCKKLMMALDSIKSACDTKTVESEIIIVDNGSNDETKNTVNKFIKNTNMNIHYTFEENKGLSFARNKGIKEASGKYLVFFDDDIIADKKYIDNLAHVTQEGLEWHMIFGQTRLYSLDLHRFSTKESDKAEIFGFPCSPWKIGNGNNMVINKIAIKDVGLFDTTLGAGTKIGAAEDTDYIYRVLRSGKEIYYSPECIVYHNHGNILKEDIDRIMYNYAKGRGAFYFKYGCKRDIYSMKLLKGELEGWIRRGLRKGFDKEVKMNLKGLIHGMGLKITADLLNWKKY